MITPATAVAVILLMAVGHLFIALASFLFLQAAGCPTPFRFVFHTHVDRLPARYLPGGIWQTISRAADFADKEIPGAVIARLLILEMGFAPCLGAVIGGTLLLHAGAEAHAIDASACPDSNPWDNWADRAAAALAGSPELFRTDTALALRYGDRRLHGRIRPSRRRVLQLCCLPTSCAALGSAAGAYWLSWVAGFLAFFAPQGIGVFEGTSSYLLTGSLAVVWSGRYSHFGSCRSWPTLGFSFVPCSAAFGAAEAVTVPAAEVANA